MSFVIQRIGFQYLLSSFRKITLLVSKINCLLRVGNTNELRFPSADIETSVFCHFLSPILFTHSQLGFGQIIPEGYNEGSHGAHFLLQGFSRWISMAEVLNTINKGELELCEIEVVCKLKSQLIFQATEVVVYSMKMQVPSLLMKKEGLNLPVLWYPTLN